ncbi:MAG: hypothetical protein PVI54_00800 [Desulfobacteraceae bacterium]
MSRAIARRVYAIANDIGAADGADDALPIASKKGDRQRTAGIQKGMLKALKFQPH